ncbi:PDDEXK nuclease domain-containing protein [Kineococcus sp. SYSU DK005]|uniref:PDDEXK nuclease domain-containing protein n=1 Tax=Kineococcus sp. SYSU DK005 TaxID=3383126 RepID=UPI003D7E361D
MPADVPAGYAELLQQLTERVRTSQVRAARAANTELLRLYHSIGRDILERQHRHGWGAKVIERLAGDLRKAFPDQRGFSRRNLHYMRALAAAWPTEDDFVPQPVAQLPWGHVRVLLDRLDQHELRQWYAAGAAQQGWSRAVLEHQIATRLHTRIGAAPSNFAAHLPPADSDLAQALTRDPYVFDHLGLSEPVAERQLEQSLMDRLQETLTAFGHGMSFVGRQVHFPVDDTEMIIDLLLFSLEQVRYVVIELKVGDFSPAYTGQLGAYVALVDERLRRPGKHAPTVGILLCTGAPREQAVRYALAGTAAPVAVASYTYDTLPPEERAGLPDAATLAAAITPATTSATSGTPTPSSPEQATQAPEGVQP